MAEQTTPTPAPAAEAKPFNTPFATMLDAVKGTLYANDKQVPETKPSPAHEPEAEQDKAVPEAAEEKRQPEITSSRDKKGRFVSLSDADVPSGEKAPEAKQPAAEEKQSAPENTGIKQLRQQYDLLKAELSNAKQELEKAKISSNPDELDKLRKTNAELSELFEKVSLEHRPDFRAKYEKPIQQAIDSALSIVPDEVKPTVKWLLEQPDSTEKLDRLEEVLSEIPVSRRAKIVALADKISTIKSERDAVVSKAHEANQEYERNSQTVRQRQSEELYNDALSAASEELPMFQTRDGDDDWNKAVLDRQNRAKHIMMKESDPRKLTEAAFWAVIGQDTFSLLSKAEKTISSLQKELDLLRASRPMAPKEQGAKSQEADRPKGFVDAFLKSMKS